MLSTSPTTNSTIFGNSGGGNHEVGFSNSNLRYRVSDGSYVDISHGNGLDIWNHFSFVRNNNDIFFYKNIIV